MVGRTTSRNTSQSAGSGITVSIRIASNTVNAYTVPAGKTARLTGILGRVDALGSDPRSALAKKAVGGTITAIGSFVNALEGSNVSRCERIVLQSGEGITTVGNLGATNTTMDISASIEEFA